MHTVCSALRLAESALPGVRWLSSLQLWSAVLKVLSRVEASCFSLPLLHKHGHMRMDHLLRSYHTSKLKQFTCLMAGVRPSL